MIEKPATPGEMTEADIERAHARAYRKHFKMADFFRPDQCLFVGLLEDADGSAWAFADAWDGYMNVPSGFHAIADGRNVRLAIRQNMETMPDPDPFPGESKDFERADHWLKARSLTRPAE